MQREWKCLGHFESLRQLYSTSLINTPKPSPVLCTQTISFPFRIVFWSNATNLKWMILYPSLWNISDEQVFLIPEQRVPGQVLLEVFSVPKCFGWFLPQTHKSVVQERQCIRC